jgi:hypothetical protein
MEIDITSLLKTNLFTFSHSAAEGGQDAGQNTWKAANRHAEETAPPLLDTPEKLDTFRDWVGDSGGWTREEIDAWTPTECNALFLQWIAGDCRECPAIGGGNAYSLEEIDWEETEVEQSNGQISSNLFRADDGRIFFSLSN